MKHAVTYQLWLVAKDAKADIQTKMLKVQAITDKEATRLGVEIATGLGLVLMKAERIER